MLPPQNVADEVYELSVKVSNLFEVFRETYILVFSHIMTLLIAMITNIINLIVAGFNERIVDKVETLGPKVLFAGILLIIGSLIAYGIFRLTMYIFKRFGIVELIDRLWEWFEENTTKMVDKTPHSPEKDKKEEVSEEKKVRYDRITAKALSYYIFLLFFRWSIVVLWVTEVEKFMNDLIGYLPSLFVGIMIGFFGLRFANSVYDIIYQALELTKNKTSRIIAMGAKIIIMFFTLMIMLHYIKIVDEFIINALFLAFMTTLTISIGLAFGLGWRDIAKEILEGFRK